MQQSTPIRGRVPSSEEGFLLVAMICAIALILIFLAVAAPTVAKELQREREIEMVHRGNQYVRAIRVYYRKNGSYPTSIDILLKSNNMRYLRQNYIDPMTGKSDWRIIHVGENQTQVTGFFGQPLAGLNGAGGIGSTGGAIQTTAGAGSSFGSSATSTTGTTGTTGSTATGASTTPASTDATTFSGGGGGPIMGVSSLSSKESIISIHGMTTYNTWEFIYDPRIEALYNNSKVMGGGGGTSGASSVGGSSIGSPMAPATGTGSPGNTPGGGQSTFGSPGSPGSSNGTGSPSIFGGL